MQMGLPPLRSGRAACVLAAAWLLLASGLSAQRSLENQHAPPFSLQDMQGRRIDLAQYRGKVVLLNFWATWCAPCRLEMPKLIEWQTRYGIQGFQVLGVSIDDTAAPVRPFLNQLHVNYPVVMGDSKLEQLYGGIDGVPVTFLIDRQGIVRERFDGGPDLGALEWEVKRLLAGH